MLIGDLAGQILCAIGLPDYGQGQSTRSLNGSASPARPPDAGSR
jgi:hypothetical protein